MLYSKENPIWREKDPANPMNSRTITLLLWMNALTALGAAAWTLAYPSEANAARLLGYSYARLALAGFELLLAGVLSVLVILAVSRKEKAIQIAKRLDAWILTGDRLFSIMAVLLGVCLLAGWCLLFSWLFIPANLRPLILWGTLASFSTWLALCIANKDTLHTRNYRQRFRLLSGLRLLDRQQKRVLGLLLGMALAAFLYYIPLNLQGIENLETFYNHPSDEVVIYPILVDTLTPGETLSATLYHVFIYEDYHYGYPFYAFSQLALLPVVLAAGQDFASQTQINLLILRQVVSVLPILLAGLVVVYLATRFKSAWKAVGLYLVILTAPGIYFYNIRFWHPDGLNTLFITLVIFFLVRDRLRFGHNFYLAAVFCGLSIGTRLYGAFFFLSVSGYLLGGLLQKRINWGQMLVHGVLFMAVMAAALLLTSPYLFRADARGRMLEIMSGKSVEMMQGYDKPDPEGIYTTGWDAWLPFFQYYFAENIFSWFLLFSTTAGFLFGRQRIFHGVLLGWVLALGAYLVYFVMVKSIHYLIPLYLPYYGGVYGFSEAVRFGLRGEGEQPPPFTHLLADGVPACFLLAQLVLNVMRLGGVR